MVKKIALEEHFLSPGLIDYWRPTMSEVPAAHSEYLFRNLTDFDELRLKAMDDAGIARAVLSIAGPGVQAERDAVIATRRARESNDFLAGEIGKRPNRYSGFAHLAMQDPIGAAEELQRCVRELKFCGAMINGHTHGQYLDHPELYPFWERADALAAVIYVHPADPVAQPSVLSGYKVLMRPMWGWGFETGSHALRLVFSGLFDRFPRAKVALGHLGETLPFLLWRFDSRAKLYGVKLAKKPSDYIRQNIVVTTSGMCATEPLDCSIAALGRERIMFAADYPFEQAAEAGEFLDKTPLPEAVREDVAFRNAARELTLPSPSRT
jgi:2,3-dihydroxybenzoate decarboxylase